MASPLISVIVPCYNQARFLSDALASLQAQTCPDWECIVVNDGSTDKTEEVAREWVKRDLRFRYLEKANGGLSSARNTGLAAAEGAYLQFLDADDALLPGKFEIQLKCIQGLSGLSLAFSDYRRGSGENIHVEPASAPYLPPRYGREPLLFQLARDWETRIGIPAHCFLFDARLFRERGLRFDANLRNHEDWDCWMQIAALRVEAQFCPEILAVYRYCPESMCGDLRAMREGFLRAIDKQMALNRSNRLLRVALARKRRETIASYARQLGEPAPTNQMRIFAGALASRVLSPRLLTWLRQHI